MFAVFRAARKSVCRGVFALSAAALVAACQPIATGGGPSINTSKPVPVALLVPGGSGQSGDEVLARHLQNAARLAASDLDGVQIDLRVYNTAGNSDQAAAMATKAVNEGAKIILGPLYAQNANAAGIATASRGVNVLSFSNNADIAGGNVFVLGPTYDNTAARMVRFAARNGKGNILIVRDGNVAGEAGAAAIRRAAANSSASVVGEAAYEFSQNGVVQAVPVIAKTAKSAGAQALFLTTDSGGALPLLSQLLPENGIKTDTYQYIGLTRWDIPPETLALPGVQGGWFALPDPTLTAQYNSRYQAAYGELPNPVSGLAYDGIAAIGALVRQGKSDALTAQALTQASGFAGVNGVFRLRPDGTNERGLAVAEIRNNQVVVIDPAPRSFGGAGF